MLFLLSGKIVMSSVGPGIIIVLLHHTVSEFRAISCYFVLGGHMPDSLACMEDIAMHFGVTAETIRNWISRRGFPAKKIGGRWRFDWSDVLEWERRCSTDNLNHESSTYKDYVTADLALKASNHDFRPSVKTPKYELLNDDCLHALASVSADSVDLLLTDPPYNLGLFMQNRSTNLKQLRENYFGAAGWDNLGPDEWTASMDAFFSEASRILRRGGALVVFMAVIKVETIIRLAQAHGFYYKTTGTWHKLNPMPRNMNLHFINSTESWVYFVNDAKTGTFNNGGKALHDFFESPVTPKSERLFGKHPTQKPLALMDYFVRALSNPDDMVLDPFMGVGSTGVSAVAMGRKFTGIEIDERYFDIAKKRLEVCDADETDRD